MPIGSQISFALARTLGSVFQPSFMLLLAVLVSAIAVLLRPTRRRQVCLTLSVSALIACGITPLASWLMKPLEDRFPATALPAQVNGIIALGGEFDLAVSDDRNVIAMNARAVRIIEFITLARRYPNAALAFSGGKASVFGSKYSEAELARRLLLNVGIDPKRITFERESRNTRENALNTARLIKPKPGQHWLLVTSAADMPRAVGCFRALGWPAIAVPVDYHTRSSWLAAPGLFDGLMQLDWATHEWLGLLYYRSRGWTSAFFPAPNAEDAVARI
jgi:uncharacterized SAM-binding protein YcdF (DUF218 family)